MSALQEIVACIEKPPFNQKLNLVDLDHKTHPQLLQLLNDVFCKIEPQQSESLLKEEIENSKRRYFEFISLLNFKRKETEQRFSQADCESLFNGDKALLFDILHFCLTKFEGLKERAYVGSFMKPFDVATEFVSIPKIHDLMSTYSELQQKFKECHKDFKKIRDSTNGHAVGALRQEINQLKSERAQLTKRLEQLREQKSAEDFGVSKEHFHSILEATSRLRKAQEEDALMFQRLQEQQEMLEASRENFAQLSERQKAFGSEDDEIDLGLIMERFQERAAEVIQLAKQYADANREKSEQVAMVEKVLILGPAPAEETELMKVEIAAIQKEIAQLHEKRDQLMEQCGGELSFSKTMLQGTLKKTNDATETLEELNLDRKDLLDELRKLDKEIANSSRGNIRPMCENEVEEYMNNLREKSQDYNKQRAVLLAMNDEVKVLENTKVILCDGRPEMLAKKQELEKNPEDPLEKQRQLESLASQNASVNEDKQAMLNETAAVVKEIDEKLKANKTRLSPLIAQLKSKRAEVMEFEDVYVEKKRSYDDNCMELNVVTDQLQGELDRIETTCMQTQQQSKLLDYRHKAQEIFLAKLEDEHAYTQGKGRFNSEFQTFAMQLDHEIARLNKIVIQARKEQRLLRQNEDKNILQREYFQKLKELFSLKVRVAEEEMKEERREMLVGEEEDRLVL